MLASVFKPHSTGMTAQNSSLAHAPLESGQSVPAGGGMDFTITDPPPDEHYRQGSRVNSGNAVQSTPYRIAICNTGLDALAKFAVRIYANLPADGSFPGLTASLTATQYIPSYHGNLKLRTLIQYPGSGACGNTGSYCHAGSNTHGDTNSGTAAIPARTATATPLRPYPDPVITAAPAPVTGGVKGQFYNQSGRLHLRRFTMGNGAIEEIEGLDFKRR
jgi:hypothetical protein